MNILVIHNKYIFSGGEDSVLQSEIAMLKSSGHNLNIFQVGNTALAGFINKIIVACEAPYSCKMKKLVTCEIDRFQPTIVHIHNFFPILTPSIYDACIDARIPIVQTLHNFRTICPGALLMRDSKICEKCISSSPYQAMLHRCYRKSILGTWAVARMVAYHRKKQTWQHKVDRFIGLTQFGKQKFVEAGFPEEKIVVKPNFCAVKDVTRATSINRNGALFVGRLSEEKGVATMLEAWWELDIPLRVTGNGPLLEQNLERHRANVSFLGRLAGEQISQEMSKASFLVMPSLCYEGFPIVLAESFAHRLPVVASRLGAMAEIVVDGVTGLHFEPGNPLDLTRKVKWLHDHPEECRQMGDNARREYEAKYTPERNYEMLMRIYEEAIEERKRVRGKEGGDRREEWLG